jgi:hypothetical protein
LEPWQKDIVATLYGWKRKDGTRRYRESLIAVPRKNGKTTIVAGLSIYNMRCDGERGPEVFVPTEDGYVLPNHMLPESMQRTGFAETFKYAADGANIKIKHGGHSDIKRWTRTFLQELGDAVGTNLFTERNMDFVGRWAQKEGGWKNNTAAYNPLNTSYRKDGSWSMNKHGVQGYRSFEDGVSANINTLLGNMADERGYTDIVKLLATPSASLDQFVRAVQKSSWGTEGDFSKHRVAWDPRAAVLKGFITPGKGGKGYSNTDVKFSDALEGYDVTGSPYGAPSDGSTGVRSGLYGGRLADRMSISEYISSITAGNYVGKTVVGGKPVGRYAGGLVRKGEQYTVGEMGAEVFSPTSASNAPGNGNIVIQKIEINVPAGHSEERLVRELKRQLTTREIIRKARTK